MSKHCSGCQCKEVAAREKYVQDAEIVEAQLNSDKPFIDDQLIYAAHDRCPACNAGMAYPKGIGAFGAWYCSAALKHEDRPEQFGKHPSLPFAFYKVKSENQPSAGGATTRPPRTA